MLEMREKEKKRNLKYREKNSHFDWLIIDKGGGVIFQNIGMVRCNLLAINHILLFD